MTGPDRRRFPRHPFRAQVKIEWGSQVLERQTRLLSTGGMFIECADQLWVGASFSVVLMLGAAVRVDCVVRMVEPGRGMGVEFFNVPAEARAQIERCITALAAQ